MNSLVLQRIAKVSGIPTKKSFQSWVDLALAEVARGEDCELLIRIVDELEIQELNARYRQHDQATNILSFPFEAPPGFPANFLGDIVICAQVVKREAQQQHKPLLAHWAHLTLHGVLHLKGYDHIEIPDAEKMENLEVVLLNRLGFDDPYL